SEAEGCTMQRHNARNIMEVAPSGDKRIPMRCSANRLSVDHSAHCKTRWLGKRPHWPERDDFDSGPYCAMTRGRNRVVECQLPNWSLALLFPATRLGASDEPDGPAVAAISGAEMTVGFYFFCAFQKSVAGLSLINCKSVKERSTSVSRSARKSSTSCLSGIPLSGVRSDTRV